MIIVHFFSGLYLQIFKDIKKFVDYFFYISIASAIIHKMKNVLIGYLVKMINLTIAWISLSIKHSSRKVNLLLINLLLHKTNQTILAPLIHANTISKLVQHKATITILHLSIEVKLTQLSPVIINSANIDHLQI